MINKKGFTLIEVILVLGIIGLFMALSTAAFMNARKSARDAKRKTDLEQIRGALETYKADNNVYPGMYSVPSLTDGTAVDTGAVYASYLSSYMASAPTDPVSTMQYKYIPSGYGYYICASLETGSSAYATGCGTNTCGTLSGVTVPCNYSISNP